MSNYIGVRCPVCTKKFVQTDDIVVCPVCGAPHHRACYANTGACAFVAEHISGKEWRAPPPEPAAGAHQPQDGTGQPVATCAHCGASNPAEMIFCQVCGGRMGGFSPQNRPPEPGQNSWTFPGYTSLDPVSLMYGGVSPDDTIEGESVRDIAAYIGENSAYYLPRFKIMDETPRTLMFNFSALIFNFLYFFYRKMYLVGSVLLVLFMVGSIPNFLRARELLPQLMYEYWRIGQQVSINQAAVDHYTSLVNLASTINFMISLVISFCANRFYYIKTIASVKKIRQSLGDAHDEKAYNGLLSKRGGVSMMAVLFVCLGLIAAFLVAAFIISYQFGGLYLS